MAVGAEPLGISTGDFNADGSLDLATADGGADSVSLLLGNSTTAPPPGGADKTPPQTSIDNGPVAQTDKNEGKDPLLGERAGDLRVQAQGQAASITDLRSFTDCGAAKVKYKNLDPGKKKFQVRAIDAAGNVDPSPAKLKWKILG